jgi:hypothetical protein
MQDLGFYFELGWHHIISWGALDHLLFITALSAVYSVVNWKQVLVLVTAFTLGHSLTLALSVFDIIRVSSKWVEFLIPCTIMATALFNFWQKDFQPRSLRMNYFFALFFGLIHGLGFASALRSMLGKYQNIGWSLFGFNAGLETGQILVVFIVLGTAYAVVNLAGLKRIWWVWFLSAIAFCKASMMAWERWPGGQW